jgi:DNA polymerase I
VLTNIWRKDLELAVKQRKKLAIIDGKSVFYRGYYAMPNLATKDGTPTGGVYGFAVMALEVIKKLKPDYVCVAWDKPKTNIRKRLELYPEYKAGRKPPPPDFYEQVPVLHELLDAFGWPLYELDDYEADDIMGSLALQATAKDIETQLITSDLDMLQLIDLHVSVYALKKGLSNIELYHPESFIEKYGILPQQFLDFKALKGDSSDNIPGVPGIGEKGAIELLKQFKTLDGVYENLDLIKDSIRKKLEAGKELAYLSKKLAAIWSDAPLKLELDNLDGSKCDPTKVRDILQRLEFRTLVRQLPEIMRMPDSPTNGGHIAAVESISIDDVEHINSSSELVKLKFSGDVIVHSHSADKLGHKPQVIIVSDKPGRVYAIDASRIEPSYIATAFENVKTVIGHDIKAFLKLLLSAGMQKLPAVGHDTLIGAFLINSLRREQTLSELAFTDLGYDGSSFDDLSPEDLLTRAGEISAVLRALAKNQKQELGKNSKAN